MVARQWDREGNKFYYLDLFVNVVELEIAVIEAGSCISLSCCMNRKIGINIKHTIWTNKDYEKFCHIHNFQVDQASCL